MNRFSAGRHWPASMNLQMWMLLLLSLPLGAIGADFERDFAVVFITKETEAKYGRCPLDRALLAHAVERVADAGAKGLILKFFFDQSKTVDGDRRLASALARVPVLLQARIDDSEKMPNPLEERFTLLGANFKTAVSGRSGWIPLPALSQTAHGVCFVDFDASPAPVVETYQGKTVKSLLTCAAELALGQKAVISPAQAISIAKHTAPLDALNRVTIALRSEKSLVSFDFMGLLDGSIPPSALRDRVVIIAYDGPGIPQINSPVGTMGAHRLFGLMLKEFYESLAPD